MKMPRIEGTLAAGALPQGTHNPGATPQSTVASEAGPMADAHPTGSTSIISSPAGDVGNHECAWPAATAPSDNCHRRYRRKCRRGNSDLGQRRRSQLFPHRLDCRIRLPSSGGRLAGTVCIR